MHSAGFAPLIYLKSRLIPVAALDIEDWDDAMKAVGMGVSAKFDAHCNRTFAFANVPGDEFAGDSIAVTVRRYPVIAISAIELDEVEISPDYRLAKNSGLVEFLGSAGTHHQTLTINYEGGYWLDPQDGTPVPTGKTALPADVLESYVAQCQAEIEGRGIFHALGLRKADSTPQPVTGLIDSVKEALNHYRRFSGA
jgi:hypothetical protein